MVAATMMRKKATTDSHWGEVKRRAQEAPAFFIVYSKASSPT